MPPWCRPVRNIKREIVVEAPAGTVKAVARPDWEAQVVANQRADAPTLEFDDLAFAAGPDFRRLLRGEFAPEEAVASGVVHVLRGRLELLERFARTFRLAA